jgi:hypothetical protein
MVRAFVLYEGRAPDPDRYRQHIDDFVSNVPGATFRHGGVFGAAMGEPRFHYYVEFESPDMQSFKEGTSSDAFAASGKDAMEMGIPFTVHFAEVE